VLATRTRRLAAAGAVLGVVLLSAAPPVAAEPVSDAVAALRVDKLYLAPEVTTVQVDSGLAGALPNDVRIAVLAAGAESADAVAGEIGRDLGSDRQHPLTIAVVTVAADDRVVMRAASSKYCPGLADAQAQATMGAGRAQTQGVGDLTPVIQDFVQRLSEVRVDDGDCPSDTSKASGRATSNAVTVGAWLTGVVGVGAAVVGGLLLYRRRSRQRELVVAGKRLTHYYDRLADEIAALEPTGVAPAHQALADASERLSSAGSRLDDADTVEKCRSVRQTLLEGLHATRSARAALGIDPGPALPAPERSELEQLHEPQQVWVQGRQYQGYPRYTPGAPYYYGGDDGIPGGWYGVRFWETVLLGGVLASGVFGDFGGGDGGSADAS
jgi:hypothetical protein